jgi:hypothetical protein
MATGGTTGRQKQRHHVFFQPGGTSAATLQLRSARNTSSSWQHTSLPQVLISQRQSARSAVAAVLSSMGIFEDSALLAQLCLRPSRAACAGIGTN